ncbi:MAG: hypothetical protein ACFHXK_00880 [bacterium]
MKKIKYLHIDGFVAEVEVDLIESELTDEWGPYLSKNDAFLLDDVKHLIRQGNLAEAAKMANIYTLTPVATGDA